MLCCAPTSYLSLLLQEDAHFLKRHEKDLGGELSRTERRVRLAYLIGREWKQLSAEKKRAFKLEKKEAKGVKLEKKEAKGVKLEEKEPAQDQQEQIKKRKRISFTSEVDQAELQRLKADISKKSKAIEAQVRARNREYYSG